MTSPGNAVRTLAFACWLAFGGALFAASQHALIITGLSGSPENTEEFNRLATETQRLLVARGFAEGNVEIMAEKPTRETILAKLAGLKTLAADDEFWLVLYGHAGKTQGNVPAFQVSGPRLTSEDLKTALDAIPAKQFVFIATNESGAFLQPLQNARRMVVTATKGDGESDQPRYPAQWVAAFGENPKASFTLIAARASELTEKEYDSSGIVQAEHARLADPVSGKILEPPFGVDMTAAQESSVPSVSSPEHLLTASDIHVKLNDPNAVWEHQPATDETKKMIADAAALPNIGGYSAIMLSQQVGFTVEQDRTTDQFMFYRVYIVKEDAVAEWARQELPQMPPMVTTRLEVARVIQPDGSSIVFNPAKLAGSGNSMESAMDNGASSTVFLPDTHAGCVVEIGFHVRALLDASLPEVSESLEVQRGIPVLSTQVEVRVPDKKPFHVVLKNDKSAPVETTENDRHVYRWKLGPMPAAESLRGDPPEQLWTVWLGISSLPSWDDFAVWFRRIAKGSDAIDDTVKKTAADLAAGAKTRREKIQRVFEYVSALRYVAVEIGIQGFRPRTPMQVLANRYGDCKDKANLIVAMLKTLGIDAQFALVNRGGMTDVDFPSWQFNHAVCFVPKDAADKNDTDLWLDSTDGVTPFGFIPPGDVGRSAFAFSADKAAFKTIAETNGSVGTLSDVWEVKAGDPSKMAKWAGTFQRKATGLSEYEMRQFFNGLSPKQREERIYESLSRLDPLAEFSKIGVSDTSDLRKPVEMRAEFQAQTPLPSPEFSWLAIFDAPERDRPLLMNDGQEFTIEQTVRMPAGAVSQDQSAASYDSEVAGEKMAVKWNKVDDKTIERIVRIEVKQPMVPAADYAALRKALREWRAAASQ